MKRRWLLGVSGLVAAGLIVGYLLRRQHLVVPVPPVPNGYDTLLQGAQHAVSDRHLAYGEATDEELVDLVARNRTALDLARLAFAHECRVTTGYGRPISDYMAQHMPVLAQFKKLALAFRAEGELAERQGKTNDAARIYLDGVRFAHELCRGGLLIDRMVGIGTERTNLDPLSGLVPYLDTAVCREAVRSLEQLEARRESIDDTQNQEKIWVSQSAGMRERMALQMMRLLRSRDLAVPWETSRAKAAEVQGRVRRLLLHLAARSYELDHGKAPQTPADLVPEYLKTVPRHPVTGQELGL